MFTLQTHRSGVLISFIMLIFTPGCMATWCFECASQIMPGCASDFRLDDGPIDNNHVVNCSTNCMKLISVSNGGRYYYIRTCDVSNYPSGSCTTGSQLLGLSRVKVCTCSSDFCNSAISFNANTIHITSLCLLMYLFA